MARFETEYVATVRIPIRSLIYPAPGSTGCTSVDRPTASSSTWTAPRALPMAIKMDRYGTDILAVAATIHTGTGPAALGRGSSATGGPSSGTQSSSICSVPSKPVPSTSKCQPPF
jgi:hypothetical protein